MDASLVVLDELHKAPKWKNLLVTGSARLDAFRRAGDAPKGRYFFYRLHPIDVAKQEYSCRNLTCTSECGGCSPPGTLLKFIQFKKDTVGERWDLYYLRDKEGHEVDFLVTLNRKVQWLEALPFE